MSGPSMSVGQQLQYERLNVEDALSFLDQVKFAKGTRVYYDFLYIMTEYRSQKIDVPAVINQVYNLFKGHQDLLVGFNAFLPPGYKIEVQCETVNVHQPGQQVMSITALAQSLNVSTVNRQNVGPVHHLSAPSASPAADHHSYNQSPRPHSETTHSTGPPVQFSHALAFINKVKNRFQGQPGVFTQFMDILERCHNENRQILNGVNSDPIKPMTEREIYHQVANLFKYHEDLLAEFGLYLQTNTRFGGSN